MLILIINFVITRFSLFMRNKRYLRTSLYILGISLICSLSAAIPVDVTFAEELDVQVEDAVDEQVEDEVESSVEDEVESNVEDEVESSVEDEVESNVEDEVEGSVEDEVEGNIEDEVEGNVEDEVEGNVEDEVEGNVEDDVEDQAEDKLDRLSGDDELGTRFERDNEVKQLSAEGIEQHTNKQNSAANKQQEEGKHITQSISANSYDERRISSAIDIVETSAGIHRIAGKLILMTDHFQRAELEKQGLEITDVIELKGLNQFLIEVEESSKNLQENSDTPLEFNDLYTLQDDTENSFLPEKKPTVSTTQLNLVKDLDSFSSYLSSNPVKVGVIDSGVDLTHHAFKQANIHAESFVVGGNPAPQTHGTAITSLLVGRSKEMHGLIPSAEIYHANVFFSAQDNKQYASIKSLILALDWMVENNVEVINMSLSGPSNPILEKTLIKVTSLGILLVAAAGNNGPSGAPAFPAAYTNVIAVTAVNQNNFAYFNANRGRYIDVAALGVDVFHAIPQNQYETSTGTSYAVPFVTAISAALLRKYNAENIEEILFESALDLGEKGKDNVYGYGLAQLTSRQLSNSISLLEK